MQAGKQIWCNGFVTIILFILKKKRTINKSRRVFRHFSSWREKILSAEHLSMFELGPSVFSHQICGPCALSICTLRRVAQVKIERWML